MHILSFDIEDWFHILDNPYTNEVVQWNSFPSRIERGVFRLLDFCDLFGVRATFFILGWVAEKAPDVVAEIFRRGHDIGCHSYLHQLVYRQTPSDFERDLLVALDRIEAACGIRAKIYRAPGFSITSDCCWAFDILVRNGIEIDCSVFPAPRAHGGLPSFPSRFPCVLKVDSGLELKVFPMSFSRVFGRRVVFSGGGYFRLLPYAAIKVGFQRSNYVMTYFHPRDFDPDQPIVPGLGPVRRFKSYVGLGSAMSKLQRLAGHSSFLPVSAAASIVDWNTMDTVQLSTVGRAPN